MRGEELWSVSEVEPQKWLQNEETWYGARLKLQIEVSRTYCTVDIGSKSQDECT